MLNALPNSHRSIKNDRGLLFLYLYLLYSPGNDHDQAAADVVGDVQRLYLLLNLKD